MLDCHSVVNEEHTCFPAMWYRNCRDFLRTRIYKDQSWKIHTLSISHKMAIMHTKSTRNVIPEKGSAQLQKSIWMQSTRSNLHLHSKYEMGKHFLALNEWRMNEASSIRCFEQFVVDGSQCVYSTGPSIQVPEGTLSPVLTVVVVVVVCNLLIYPAKQEHKKLFFCKWACTRSKSIVANSFLGGMRRRPLTGPRLP